MSGVYVDEHVCRLRAGGWSYESKIACVGRRISGPWARPPTRSLRLVRRTS